MNPTEYGKHLLGEGSDEMQCQRCGRVTEHERVSLSGAKHGTTPLGTEYRWVLSVWKCSVCEEMNR